MKRILMLAAVLGVLPASARQDEKFEWSTDLDAARAQAKKEGKPLLVVFR